MFRHAHPPALYGSKLKLEYYKCLVFDRVTPQLFRSATNKDVLQTSAVKVSGIKNSLCVIRLHSKISLISVYSFWEVSNVRVARTVFSKCFVCVNFKLCVNCSVRLLCQRKHHQYCAKLVFSDVPTRILIIRCKVIASELVSEHVGVGFDGRLQIDILRTGYTYTGKELTWWLTWESRNSVN